MDKFVNKIYREKLRLTYTGIGSLPFKDKNAPNESINYVFDYSHTGHNCRTLKKKKIWHTSLPKIF